jgi:hypothetical protein
MKIREIRLLSMPRMVALAGATSEAPITSINDDPSSGVDVDVPERCVDTDSFGQPLVDTSLKRHAE